MSCKYFTKTCANCGYKDDYLVFFNEENNNDFSLKNYDEYKNFDLQICPHCEYISIDIEDGYFENCKEIMVSDKYQIAKNYLYLNGLGHKLNENYMESYRASEYECFGILRECSGDIENAIRGYYKSVLLKEVLARRFEQQKLDDYEDESKETLKEYDELKALLTKSIESNLNTIFLLYEKSSKNIYLSLIEIECLLRYNEIDKANNIFNDIKNNLKKDLVLYIEGLIAQRR